MKVNELFAVLVAAVIFIFAVTKVKKALFKLIIMAIAILIFVFYFLPQLRMM